MTNDTPGQPKTFTDPATGRSYEVGPDGSSRWLDGQPGATPAAPAAPAAKKKRAWLVPTIVGVVALFVGVGIGGSDSGTTTAGGTTPDPATTVTVTTAAEPGAAVTVTSPPVTVTAAAPAPAAPAAPAAATVGEGQWIVGEDMAAGDWRMVEAYEDGGIGCFWSIYKAGSNQSDIIQNDIVTGGKARVSVKKGQEFETQGCGDWEKIG